MCPITENHFTIMMCSINCTNITVVSHDFHAHNIIEYNMCNCCACKIKVRTLVWTPDSLYK